MPIEALSKISFYIVAHADDWQLFMQPNAYNDLTTPGSKVYFIVTTAGDAGLGESYWRAREEGMKSSVRMCLAAVGRITESEETGTFNGHKVSCWRANNAACFFLRLPDGNIDGAGFKANGNQSLLKFREGAIKQMAAIDNSSVYENWQDVSATLEAIILSAGYHVSNLSIHYLNTDTGLNPNDHADHNMTGHAIADMPIANTLQQVLYRGYSVPAVQRNLQPNVLFWKTSMFAAYEKAVYDISGYSTLKESVPTYINWCLACADYVVIKPKHGNE